MTKTELLAELATKFETVEPEEDVSTTKELDAGYHHFLVGVWDLLEAGEALVRRNVSFYVDAPGGATDPAYWQGGEPNPDAPVTFPQEVQTFIDAAIAAGSIEAAFLTKINEVSETAEAEATIDNAGTLEIKTGLFDRDGSGDIQLRVIG